MNVCAELSGRGGNTPPDFPHPASYNIQQPAHVMLWESVLVIYNIIVRLKVRFINDNLRMCTAKGADQRLDA